MLRRARAQGLWFAAPGGAWCDLRVGRSHKKHLSGPAANFAMLFEEVWARAVAGSCASLACVISIIQVRAKSASASYAGQRGMVCVSDALPSHDWRLSSHNVDSAASKVLLGACVPGTTRQCLRLLPLPSSWAQSRAAPAQALSELLCAAAAGLRPVLLRNGALYWAVGLLLEGCTRRNGGSGERVALLRRPGRAPVVSGAWADRV